MMPSTLKKLLDIALVIGLISHVKDHYKGKAINKNLDKATKLMEDSAALFPEGLTDKEVSRAEKKILRLEKWLKGRKPLLYTAVALGLLNDMQMFSQKTPLITQNLREAEKVIYNIHKYLDRNLDKENEYKEASRIISYWKDMN